MRSFEQRIRSFFGQFALALFILTVLRIAFYSYNTNLFPDVTLGEFTSGIRFDFSAIFWVHLPFIVLSLVGLAINLPRLLEYVREFLFQVGMLFSIVFSIIDMEYFRFTLKRSTYDIIRWTDSGGDLAELAPKFITEFWPLTLFFILLTTFSFWGYRKIQHHHFNVQPKNRTWYEKAIVIVLATAFIIIGGRGGFSLIPINIVDAGMYTSTQNVPLVLSTPFTIVRTWGKKGMPTYNYYPKEELSQIFSPINELQNDSSFTRRNVVILILESFSDQYTNDSELAQKLTPYLQKLKNRSTYFPNCFANGKQSIEALPAILSGIPTLMNDPFISSNYGGNKFGSLATYLKPYGYNTSFFHGGKNGTMNFDGYTKAASFDAYFGKNEYPDQSDYDGTWGISDEPFMQYFAKTLDRTKEPFVSSLFTLSSHHPYKVPEAHKDRFTSNGEPIEAVIQYTDFALERFFETAEDMPWYSNTIFILTADHTPWSNNAVLNNSYWRYRIPLLIFDPSNQVGERNLRTCQQTDILPTVLDMLNYSGPVFSYGQSLFNSEQGYSVQSMNQIHQLISNDMLYQLNDKGPIACYNLKEDPSLQSPSTNMDICQQLDSKLKGILQSYGDRMNNNKLFIE